MPCGDDHGSDHVQCAVSLQYMNSWGVVTLSTRRACLAGGPGEADNGSAGRLWRSAPGHSRGSQDPWPDEYLELGAAVWPFLN